MTCSATAFRLDPPLASLSPLGLLPRRLSLLLARCRGYTLLPAVSLFACLVSFAASPRPTADRVYPRVILTCPLTGSGAAGDSRRPLFSHSKAEIAAAARAGTPLPPLFYRMEIADDGKTAIVEFSSPSAKVLATVRGAAAASADPTVHFYDTNSVSYSAIEQSLQKIKASFTLSRFLGAPPPPKAAPAAAN